MTCPGQLRRLAATRRSIVEVHFHMPGSAKRLGTVVMAASWYTAIYRHKILKTKGLRTFRCFPKAARLGSATKGSHSSQNEVGYISEIRQPFLTGFFPLLFSFHSLSSLYTRTLVRQLFLLIHRAVAAFCNNGPGSCWADMLDLINDAQSGAMSYRHSGGDQSGCKGQSSLMMYMCKHILNAI